PSRCLISKISDSRAQFDLVFWTNRPKNMRYSSRMELQEMLISRLTSPIVGRGAQQDTAALRQMVRGRVQQKPHPGQLGFLTSSSISLRKSSSSSSFFLGLGPDLKWSGTVSSNSACSAESRSIRAGAVLGRAARLGLSS